MWLNAWILHREGAIAASCAGTMPPTRALGARESTSLRRNPYHGSLTPAGISWPIMHSYGMLAMLALLIASCTGRGGAAADPSRPTPVAEPGPGTATAPTPRRQEGSGDPEQ